MVWVGELSAQYSTAWHTTLLRLWVEEVVVLLPVVYLFFGNCCGYLQGILFDWADLEWGVWKS